MPRLLQTGRGALGETSERKYSANAQREPRKEKRYGDDRADGEELPA